MSSWKIKANILSLVLLCAQESNSPTSVKICLSTIGEELIFSISDINSAYNSHQDQRPFSSTEQDAINSKVIGLTPSEQVHCHNLFK